MPRLYLPEAKVVFLCIACYAVSLTAAAHSDYGRPFEPVTLVDIPIRLHDGSASTLQELLAGKITALQLVFTRCSSVCPIQASVFKAIEDENASADHAYDYQLLSISVDPEYDNPEFLAEWRSRWSTGDRWQVGASDYINTTRLVEQLISDDVPTQVPVYRASDSIVAAESDAHHSAQLYFIGPEGNLLYRSFEFPTKEVVMQLFSQISDYLSDDMNSGTCR